MLLCGSGKSSHAGMRHDLREGEGEPDLAAQELDRLAALDEVVEAAVAHGYESRDVELEGGYDYGVE